MSLEEVAKRARVSLLKRGDRIEIEVRDWGAGFDPASVGKQRFGLQGIRERARLLGGKVSIESATKKGTRINVELPMIRADNALYYAKHKGRNRLVVDRRIEPRR